MIFLHVFNTYKGDLVPVPWNWSMKEEAVISISLMTIDAVVQNPTLPENIIAGSRVNELKECALFFFSLKHTGALSPLHSPPVIHS